MLGNLVIFSITLLTLILTAAAAPPQLLKRVDPPSDFNITGFSINGDVCKSISVYTTLSDDHYSLSVTLNNFWIQFDSGTPIYQRTIACILTGSLQIPAGYNLGLSAVDYSGPFELDEGITLNLQTVYHFLDDNANATAALTLAGPLDGDGQTYDATFSPSVSSSCGSATKLIINVSLSGSATDGATYDPVSDDINYYQDFDLNWSTC